MGRFPADFGAVLDYNEVTVQHWVWAEGWNSACEVTMYRCLGLTRLQSAISVKLHELHFQPGITRSSEMLKHECQASSLLASIYSAAGREES